MSEAFPSVSLSTTPRHTSTTFIETSIQKIIISVLLTLHFEGNFLTLIHEFLNGRLHPEQLRGGVEHLRVKLPALLKLGHQVHPPGEGPQVDDVHDLLLAAPLDTRQLLLSPVVEELQHFLLITREIVIGGALNRVGGL